MPVPVNCSRIYQSMYYQPILHAYPSRLRIQVYVNCMTIKNEPPCTIISYALRPHVVNNDKFCIRIVDIETKGNMKKEWGRLGSSPYKLLRY